MKVLTTPSILKIFKEQQDFLKGRGVEFFFLQKGMPKIKYDLWILKKEEEGEENLKTIEDPLLKIILTDKVKEKNLEEKIFYFPESLFQKDFKISWEIIEQHFNISRKHTLLKVQVDLLKSVESLFLTQELDKVISEILESICKVLPSKGTSFLLLRDYKKSSYEMYLPLHQKRQALEKPKYTFHPEFLDEILYSEKPYAYIEDPNNPEKKLLALPIKGTQRGNALALISIENEIEEELLYLASNFALELSSVLENLLLFIETKELTVKDDLTQAYNRRYFEAFIDEELERAKRYGTTFSIIFLDLDDLKSVNNKYGHLMGSRTLQEVAKRIISSVRNVDRVMRFGGDEFCIILPYTHTEEALIVANRVREAIAEKPFYLSPNVEVAITVSMGIATFPDHGRTKETLIAKADQAMFEVKQKKKNAVAIAKNV
ncbi:MAG: GGDEF domain-containing protein [Thermoanaerobaculia bacterium]